MQKKQERMRPTRQLEQKRQRENANVRLIHVECTGRNNAKRCWKKTKNERRELKLQDKTCLRFAVRTQDTFQQTDLHASTQVVTGS